MAGGLPPDPPVARRAARAGGRKAKESAASRPGRNGGHWAPRGRARRETQGPAICAVAVIEMLLKSYKDAKAAGQHGPAVRAVELLGKHLATSRSKARDRLLLRHDPARVFLQDRIDDDR